MFLGEWMDGEQQNWRISVKCIDAFVACKWILTSGAGPLHVLKLLDTSIQSIITQLSGTFSDRMQHAMGQTNF